ncbi:rhodanese-like domain-containing protein [Motilimonas sp. KMU-193]|uniref:rhodanese-like domain-containing protein n=1 Tax=Motilimonas sp. KMU-193 TaxID=3388668 RepID=UPI00396B46F7
MDPMKLILTLVLCFFTSLAFANNPVPIVSQQELITWQQANKDMQIIDVRSPSEFAQGHVQGAINIPYDQIGQQLSRLSQTKDIVVYCRSGRRAAIAEQTLLKQGFNRVFHLEGDILGWQANGLPLTQP